MCEKTLNEQNVYTEQRCVDAIPCPIYHNKNTPKSSRVQNKISHLVVTKTQNRKKCKKKKKNEKLKMKHFSFEHTLFHIARTQLAHKTKITKFGKKNSLFLLSEFSVQLLVFNKTKCKLSTSKQN